ncbi:MAG: hypothetical protein HUU41_11810 [Bryobacteraceae bacterium]|nr:hypothetical protein [Bryobacterales bacterium]MEB2363759.1 hypothetical protein [Bryobacterales bacterium]NUN01792.1 hypothetical protein [Bryobacteraceae bacterium]
MNSPSRLERLFRHENRYLPPLLSTAILIVGHLSYGLLESFSRTLLAVATSIALELVLGRLAYGKIPNIGSAYMTGISVGILLRSPEYWPYALTSAISIMSKYVIRWRGRHLWNPSNFAICAMLLLAPEVVAALSIQWGNDIRPMIIIWLVGIWVVWRVRLFHLSMSYAASFVVLAFARSAITGHAFLAEVAPITGPMYQLFVFLMMTDPKTTVKPRWAQILVAVLVAVVEMILRLEEVIYAPFYALTIVGPAAMAIEIWRTTTPDSRAVEKLTPA